MLNYDENEQLFQEYINNCRKRIEETFFDEEELRKGELVKKADISVGLANPETSVEAAIKNRRNRLIDIKLSHTMRVVNDVSFMAEKIHAPIDFEKLLKVAALLHDIGRFEQAIQNNDYTNDTKAKGLEGMYHAQYGHKMLVTYHGFDYYQIPEQYQFAVGEVVKHHQDSILPDEYSFKFDSAEGQLKANNFLTGNSILNFHEKVIVSALLRLVRDVDMVDILYQHLTGEFPVYNPTITYKVINPNNENDVVTLDQVAKRFNINKKVLIDYNKLEDEDISSMRTIDVPTDKVDPATLAVPEDIQAKFFNNKPLELKELMARRDWTFITGMWWRLNKFLNSITFVSNLEIIEENHLLDQIYETYPDQLKPLVAPAFEYAKRVLISKVMEDNQNEIYIRR